MDSLWEPCQVKPTPYKAFGQTCKVYVVDHVVVRLSLQMLSGP